ncbi:MAG: hypothetical protein ACRCY3_12990 [Sphingorhabdus sp.]
MAQTSPVCLYFREPAETVVERFHENIATSDTVLFDSDSETIMGNCRTLLFEGLTFVASVSPISGVALGLRPIFMAASVDSFRSMIMLEFSHHLADGIRVSALAKGYLKFSAHLAELLHADAIVSSNGRVISDKEYFVEAVRNYTENGPFPALALIGFDQSEPVLCVKTRGLSIFTGQEILFDGGGLSETAIMQRMVRLVHDLCVNGPVLTDQTVADLEAGQNLSLIPDPENNLLKISLHFGA